jgi:uncharacterized protein YyaL (SSP411 family)
MRAVNYVLLARILVFSLLGLSCFASSTEENAPVREDSTGLPGTVPFSLELREQLNLALAAKGPEYRPRTRHLDEDGSARYSNRLLLETSPYLLQHAHNPVNWYPWGDEAFETARRLGRPVLLSIGYSTCHWCHVMEEESFEDPEIAAYLNANYIAIKVDREERPDVDAIYMQAVQLLTGRGGWPMTTWLTPDRQPFFGGTYFPARDGDRGTRKGFLTLLTELKGFYDAQPDKAAERANEITQRVRKGLAPAPGSPPAAEALVTKAVQVYASMVDRTHGGLNGSPKFPSSLPLRLLVRESHRTGNETYGEMAVLTLNKMAEGGIYDQVGGGFHRYSTDNRWLVPHFEKMLYDNALLVLAYLDGFQATGDKPFARVAEEVLTYVVREMTSAEGGFYSATDADSLVPGGEREEGWFFTWTPQELSRILGPQTASLVAEYYGVSDSGNFEGRSILHVASRIEPVAERLEIQTEELALALARARERLYAAREKRPAPLRDDKILTAWNGLMISAMARGGFVLGEPAYIAVAERAATFVLEHLRSDGRLLRSYNDGRARHNAYLDDYAFLIAGLIDLHQTSHDSRWLGNAIELQATLDRHFWDSSSGGYFMTSDDHETLLAREKPAYDGAIPAGNSVALMNLVRLHALTLDDAYRSRADALLRGFGDRLSRYPTGLGEMLLALQFRLADPKEIVIVTPQRRDQAEPFLAVLREKYLPHAVVSVAVEGPDLDAQAKLMPPLEGKVARDGRATAYVCRQGICRLPVTDADGFTRQIETPPQSTGAGDPEK